MTLDMKLLDELHRQSRSLRRDIELERDVLDALLRFRVIAAQHGSQTRHALLEQAISRTEQRLHDLRWESEHVHAKINASLSFRGVNNETVA